MEPNIKSEGLLKNLELDQLKDLFTEQILFMNIGKCSDQKKKKDLSSNQTATTNSSKAKCHKLMKQKITNNFELLCKSEN